MKLTFLKKASKIKTFRTNNKNPASHYYSKCIKFESLYIIPQQ